MFQVIAATIIVCFAAGFALWMLVPPLRRRFGVKAAAGACGGCANCGSADPGVVAGAAATARPQPIRIVRSAARRASPAGTTGRS